MKIFKLLLLFFIGTISSYAQITIQLQQPPPFQFKLEHMWKVTLINPTNTTYTVYLHGVATESAKGQIVAATTTAFTLAPGVKVVNSREIVLKNVDVKNSKYADVIQNINAVPTGDYEICVTVMNAETEVQLGTQCMQAQTQNLSQVELLQPENNTKFLSGAITENHSDNIGESKIIPGSFITFNWLPPSPIPPGVKATYAIRITEIFGNQSPYDAVLSNPAFFKNQNINSNVFLYPVSGRKFQNNKRYAWKVSAYLNNVLISESETWEFTYTDDSQHNRVNDDTSSAHERGSGANSFFQQRMLLASTDDSQLPHMIYDNEKENEIKPIVFSGNAKLSFDAGYKNLPFSELPKNILTAELDPSVTIYGLPFTANILLSTQKGTDQKSINSVAFNFDVHSYKEQLKSRLGDEIKERATGWEKLMMSVNALGIGTNYPSYSEYTLNGVPVTGINVEVNPGIFYAAFTASKNQSSVENSAYQRNLYAGRLGIGKKDGTHLFFTGVYVRDDENSITVSSNNSALGPSVPSNNLTLTPKANYVSGAETNLALFDEHILIEGEGNVSVLTRDTRDANLESDAIPNFIKRMVTPKISTSFDYSYAGKISFNNSKSATRISFGIKMIGPGYTSLGVPSLRNDQLAYDAKVEQKFFERHLSLGAFFKNSHDNLIEWKSSTTTTTAFGINLGLNFPKLPFLQVSYSPYLQKNDDTVLVQKVENKTTMFSAVTGYNLLIEEFNLSTTVAFISNEAKSLNGLSNYRTNSISITEAVSFNKPVSFAGTWGLIKTASPLLNSDINNIDFSVNVILSEYLSSTLGLNYTAERAINKKTGFYLDTAISPWNNITLNARLEESTYKDLVDNSFNYNELLLKVVLNVSW